MARSIGKARVRSESFRPHGGRPPGPGRSDFGRTDPDRAPRWRTLPARDGLRQPRRPARPRRRQHRPAGVHPRRDPLDVRRRRAPGLALCGPARGLGGRPGDVVAWIGDNTPAGALAYFGAAWAGAVLAPLHLRLTDADLRRVLAHAGAKVVLVEAAHRARAEGWGLPLLDLAAATRAARARTATT